MTTKRFVECVKSGGFIDYDGFGYYATKNKMTDKVVYPSHITGKTKVFSYKTGKFRIVKVKEKFDKSFSHIVWFNR